jgi:hypothetical protein
MSDYGELLTETALPYFFRCQGKHREHSNHDLNDDVGHRRPKWHLGINMKAFQEIPNTLEELNKRVITCIDTQAV